MNQETEQPKQGSPASLTQPFGPTKSRGKGRLWTWLVVLAVLLTTVIVAAKLYEGESDEGSGGTFAAQRTDLIITVTEGGSIRAHKSIRYTCEVERRGGGDITILSVVPAGTYITQQDVDNGMVLIELDASALEESLVSEKMELNGDHETMTSAEEAYLIQKIQNGSDVAESQLAVRFALMDLQKYLGADLAYQLTADITDANDLSAYVAPLLEQVQVDPNLLDGSAAGQELKGFGDQIVIAQGNMKTAQAQLIGTRKLHDANYVSDLDLDRDQLIVVNRTFAEEDAGVNMELFLAYDFPKNAEQFLSNYIEAGRKLERTYAQCRSLIAQTQAKRLNAKEIFLAQEKRVAKMETQITNCVMQAKAPGLVIYGSGDSSDRFRMMRGRGGGGGMIAEGESVYEGQTLLSMPDTASMVAEISVHETEVDKVRPGQLAEIVMDAFPDTRLEGEVLEVAPLPDQQRGFMSPDIKVYKTLVRINGTHDFLRTRMSCKVEILVHHLKDVVVVPIQVVANRGGRKVVYVKTAQGGSEEREVDTGAFNDTFVQIIAGLDENEEVLLNPPLMTGSSASQAFQGRRSRIGQAADANDGAAGPQGRPTANIGRPKAGQGRGPEGSGPTAERIKQMTPEQREQMRQRFQGQGGRGSGQGGPRQGRGGQGPRRDGGGGERSSPPGSQGPRNQP